MLTGKHEMNCGTALCHHGQQLAHAVIGCEVRILDDHFALGAGDHDGIEQRHD